jgi:endonuclease YncB( thermonuclease family)
LRNFNHLTPVPTSTADSATGGQTRRGYWNAVLAGALAGIFAAVVGLVVAEYWHSPAPPAARPDISSTAQPTARNSITAQVIGIVDGDTISVRSQQNDHVTVRLAEIDAPEWNQPWGNRSKVALSNLISDREVEIQTAGVDRYGRQLGRIFLSGMDINAEMIRAGHAWAYRDYLSDKSLLTIETQAREAKRGLWSLPFNDRVAPWDWRHNPNPSRIAKSVPNASFTPAVSNSGRQCFGKRYCREMASCEEANFYLKFCGVDSLDGDDDGVPCETICRRPFR